MISFKQKAITLSAVSVVLLGAWALSLIVSPEQKAAGIAKMILLPAKAEVSSIEFQAGQTSKVSVVKQGNVWYLMDGQQKLPVTASKIDGFIKALQGETTLKLVANQKSSWEGLSLDAEHAKTAVLKDAAGKVLASVALGSWDSGTNGMYVRIGDAEKAYSMPDTLSAYISGGRDYWLNKKILPETVLAKDVQNASLDAKITFAKSPPLSFSYSLARNDKGWKSGSLDLDEQKTSALIQSIIDLQGTDVFSSVPQDAFGTISATIALNLAAGTKATLKVGALDSAKPDNYWVKLEGSDYAYVVSSDSLKSILKPVAELKK